MQTYTIIDDGAALWVAYTNELESTLDSLGWSVSGDLITEPEMGEDADPGAAYSDLCDALIEVAGPNSSIRGFDIWAAYPGANVLIADPGAGSREWTWKSGEVLPQRVYRVEEGEATDVSHQPSAIPADGEESVMVIARTEEEAVWIASLYDTDELGVSNVSRAYSGMRAMCTWLEQRIAAVARGED